MNSETEKHVLMCNSFKAQIKVIAEMIDQWDTKEGIIFAGTGYGRVIGYLEQASLALDEMIEDMLNYEEAVDEGEFMKDEDIIFGFEGKPE